MTKTFKQFLEDLDSKQFTFAELLHGPCAPFFRQSQKNGMLVRGMNGFGQLVGEMSLGEGFGDIKFTVFKKTVRKDRRPIDTARELSKVIDDWFEDEKGIRARSEAVFCFGEAARKIAYEYGTLAVVLPIGKFTYVWSPDVPDLFDDVIRGRLQTDQGEIKPAYLDSRGKVDVETVHNLLNSLHYTINGFDKAVGDSVEIMIDCDEYYVIPMPNDEENQEKFLAILKKAFVNA